MVAVDVNGRAFSAELYVEPSESSWGYLVNRVGFAVAQQRPQFVVGGTGKSRRIISEASRG